MQSKGATLQLNVVVTWGVAASPLRAPHTTYKNLGQRRKLPQLGPGSQIDFYALCFLLSRQW